MSTPTDPLEDPVSEHIDENLALLQGGSRDGESTHVSSDVRRLLAVSEAPGMIDVYTRTEESAPVRGASSPGVVFVFTGQEVASDLAPEMVHLPSS